jgi:hypothetical protein
MFWKRLLPAVMLPLLLASCLLQPGKFASTLTVHSDRTFAFTYKGEVIQVDPTSSLGNAFSASTDKSDDKTPTEEEKAAALKKIKDAADLENKRKAIAEALAKEEGYKSVQYLGNGKFMVDYAISGTLDHNFLYPFNIDGEAIFPFIAIELRKDGAVRVMAPAFSADQGKSTGMSDANPMGGSAGGGNNALDGSFTLTTDAEVVMHNSEDGVKPTGAMKTITWRATPLTKTAPTAVLRLRK